MRVLFVAAMLASAALAELNYISPEDLAAGLAKAQSLYETRDIDGLLM